MTPVERRFVALWATAVAAVLVAFLTVAACSAKDDGTTPRDCGELDQPQHCEGQ